MLPQTPFTASRIPIDSDNHITTSFATPSLLLPFIVSLLRVNWGLPISMVKVLIMMADYGHDPTGACSHSAAQLWSILVNCQLTSFRLTIL